MDVRRSSRVRAPSSRLAVDDDDDDFADCTPPTSKKVRLEPTATKETKSNVREPTAKTDVFSKSGNTATKLPEGRPHLDEKLLRRDIDTAVKLSMNSSAALSKQPSPKMSRGQRPRNPKLQEETSASDDDDDVIIVEESDDKSSTKSLKKDDKNKDHIDYRPPKCDPPKEIVVPPVTKKLDKKNKFVSKSASPSPAIASQTTPVIGAMKPATPLVGVSQSRTPGSAKRHMTGMNKLSSPGVSALGNNLGGVKLASPGQPLRLGLSRNTRVVKPLHANVRLAPST